MQWLNVAPSSNLRLALPHVRLAGLHGWPGVLQAIQTAYLADVLKNQVHCPPLCALLEACRSPEHCAGLCLAAGLSSLHSGSDVLQASLPDRPA